MKLQILFKIVVFAFTTTLPAFADPFESQGDPVGFMKLKVNAVPSGQSYQYSFDGLGLTRPVLVQARANGVGTNTLVDNGATWADNQFNGGNGAHYLEVTSGPYEGWTYDITATSAGSKSVTVTPNFENDIDDDVQFRIRKHWTIATLFGPNNEAGFLSGSQTAADQIRILDAATGIYTTYYYKVGGVSGGNGWRTSGDLATSQNDAVIRPHKGLLIQRLGSGASELKVLLLGSVKMEKTAMTITVGTSIVPNPYPVPMTLESSNLYTGNSSTGLRGDHQSNADNIFIYQPATQSYKAYYYKIGGVAGGNGWRTSGDLFTDQKDVEIPVGCAILIQRYGSEFKWISSQHPSSY